MLKSVFGIRDDEKALSILVDLPTEMLPDSPSWKDRRRLAAEWFTMLHNQMQRLPFTAVNCCVYPNVGSNNNDLPESLTLVETSTRSKAGAAPHEVGLQEILSSSSVVLAMTQLSATAPLKILARTFGFRGATMPGLSRSMISALMLDYEKVNARVLQIKHRMDRAESASIVFSCEGRRHELLIDLRHRTGHASGGIIREPGTVANLPSGEAYIVPYEGEREGDASRTAGVLPVQFEREIVAFDVKNNRAVSANGRGRHAETQNALLKEEPAYGNLAELGIGVLGEWGITAVGSTLLDEKLGLHVAFGRSDHFGGATDPSLFQDPRKVVHQDWVYVPSLQPLVSVPEAAFTYADGSREVVVRNGQVAL
jgi:leucyl aminopeptidase (aminopeptidase T)